MKSIFQLAKNAVKLTIAIYYRSQHVRLAYQEYAI